MSFDRDTCKETTFKSRDLIREYLLKTRVPEILKPQQGRRHSAAFTTSAVVAEMNFAYKHPLVIAEELKQQINGSGEALADGMERKLSNVADNSSIIIPKAIRPVKKAVRDDRPRLIGKVTPSIARTWEQLSGTMEHSIESHPEEDDKQSYVLFVRKPFNFHATDDDHFAVNKIQHDASEKFFDSIENDSIAEYEEESYVEGGEEMAEELDSLEMQKHRSDIMLWSIES